jgi:hypothetical protein
VGAGVEEVAEAVAYEVEGEDAEGKSGGGEEDEVGGFEEVGAGVVEHGSPGRGGGLDAEAEEAQGGFGKHGGGHSYGGLYDERLHDVGQDVVQHEAEVVSAERTGGLDELALLHGDDLRADEAGVVDPTGEREREDEVEEVGAEEGYEGDGEEDAGHREEGVGDIDVDEGVCRAAVETGDGTENQAERERESDDGDCDDERDAGAVEGAGEDIAAEFVGTEPMACGGWNEACAEVELCGVVMREQRREDGADEKNQQDSDAGDGQTMLCDSSQKQARVGEGIVGCFRHSRTFRIWMIRFCGCGNRRDRIP